MGKDPGAATRSLIHGAGGAENALTKGLDFTGMARQAEEQVQSELSIEGVIAVYRKRAARLQAASDLYWSAILGAKDMEHLDRYMQRFGWLQASSLRALQVVHELEKASGDTAAIEVLEAVRKHGSKDK